MRPKKSCPGVRSYVVDHSSKRSMSPWCALGMARLHQTTSRGASAHTSAASPMSLQAVAIPSSQTRLQGCLALPDGPGPHPGVVVIHEIYGLNDNIRDITGRLAAEGYASLAVDLFSERNRVICMARLMGGTLTGQGGFAVNDLQASADFLIAQPSVDPQRIGAVGFCMGGGLAIAWGYRDRRLCAIAPFYGT